MVEPDLIFEILVYHPLTYEHDDDEVEHVLERLIIIDEIEIDARHVVTIDEDEVEVIAVVQHDEIDEVEQYI